MKNRSGDDSRLRRAAEKRMRSQVDPPEEISVEDAKNLIHELRAHQIELEMQNEELRQAHAQLEESRTRYADLYDFAPVGYLALDDKGHVVEANLAAAAQLGTERTRLIGTVFPLYMNPKDRRQAHLHIMTVFKARGRQTCELRLKPKGGEEFYARLESIFIENTNGEGRCRTSISDVSNARRAEEALHRAHDELEERVRERTGELAEANERLRQEITERKQAEGALRQSEDRFRALVQASSNVIYRMSPDWGQMRQLHGRDFISDTETPNSTWLQKYIHPEDQPLVTATINEAIRSKTIFELEHRVLRVDGSLGWTFSRAIPLLDQNGEIVEWFGAASDITERNRAEENVARLASIVESSDDAIIGKTSDGEITTWNRAAEKVYGYTAEEVIGQSISVLAPHDRHDEVPAIIQRISCGEDVKHYETLRRRKDGRNIDVSLTVSAIRDASGKIIGASTIARDITERKRAETELRENQTLLRAVTEGTPDPVFVKDCESRILLGNPALLKVWGKSLEDVVGKNDRELYEDPAIGEAMIANDRMVLQSGTSQAIEEVVQTSDGLRTYLSTKTPYRNSNGEIVGILGIARDITQRKHMEDNLIESQSRLDLALRSAHMGVWHWDIIEDRRWFDDQVCHLLGINPAEFTGTADEFFKAVHPGDRSAIRAALARAIEQDGLYETEYRAVWPDSSVHHITARGKVVRHDNGSPVRLNGIIWDITGRKQMEEELRESQQKNEFLADIIRISSQPFVVGYPDGRLGLVNSAFERLTGYSSDELQSIDWAIDLTPPEWLPFERQKLEEQILTGKPIRYEKEYIRKDGSRVPIELLVHLVTDSDGKPQYYYSFLTDITQRKKMEEALRGKEATLRGILDAAKESIWLLSPDGFIITANETALLLHGKSVSEVSGKHYTEILRTELAHSRLEHLRDVGESGRAVEFEDQREGIFFHHNLYPVLDAEERVTSVVCFSRDITERKRMEDELRKSRDQLELRVQERTADLEKVNDELLIEIQERRRADEAVRASEREFRLLAEAMPQIVWITRPDGWNIYFNQRWLDYTGQTLEESYGHGWNKPFHPDDQQRAWDAWQNATKNGAVYDLECRLRRADGLYRWWLIRGVPVLDERGTILKWFGTCTDIDERKRMEEALHKSLNELEFNVQERTATIARLELVNAELQEFAFVASHDLQEPLRKIQTFCDMTQKRCAHVLDSTSKDYMDRVVNSASRMRQLLSDLLEFSRAATRPDPLKKIDLVKVVQEAADVFESSIKEIGCQIEIENIPAIEADESQMSRLFQNLIGNALKFHGGETPRIKVYGKLDKKRICEIFVKDNGIGFDPKFAELIFKPFQRLHGRSEYDGTGMGLSICRKIVERHGGDIRAESEPGKGSTFIIRLPIKQDRWEEYGG